MKIIAKTTTRIAGLFIILLILSSCSNENRAAKQSEEKADKVFKVSTAVTIGKTVQRTVETTGTLAPWDEITVGNETPGTVDKIFADLGDEVVEGKLLLTLDQQEAKANFNSADANFKKADAVWTDADINLKRYLNLFSEGMISTSQRDAVQTQYNVADAQLKQAEAQFELAKKRLADTEIRAPISGYVKKRLVSAGEMLKDKSTLFVLVKNDPLKFQSAVPESFAHHIKIDQDVVISIDAFLDKTFPGKIIRISPSVDEKTRTLSIEAKVPNLDNILKSGYFAKAVIKMKEDKNVPFIPEAALYSVAGINKVYVIVNGAAKERLVETGGSDAGMVEIVKGVKSGETVATTGLDQLFDGAKVEMGGGK